MAYASSGQNHSRRRLRIPDDGGWYFLSGKGTAVAALRSSAGTAGVALRNRLVRLLRNGTAAAMRIAQADNSNPPERNGMI